MLSFVDVTFAGLLAWVLDERHAMRPNCDLYQRSVVAVDIDLH